MSEVKLASICGISNVICTLYIDAFCLPFRPNGHIGRIKTGQIDKSNNKFGLICDMTLYCAKAI
nr:MAG TPA: hypothetical protein [Caudoviricetes sp.]